MKLRQLTKALLLALSTPGALFAEDFVCTPWATDGVERGGPVEIQLLENLLVIRDGGPMLTAQAVYISLDTRTFMARDDGIIVVYGQPNFEGATPTLGPPIKLVSMSYDPNEIRIDEAFCE